jgi:hypothetical protein
MYLIFSSFLQVDKNVPVYFWDLLFFNYPLFTFIVSSKTEAGSAGEQPARDSLMLLK